MNPSFLSFILFTQTETPSILRFFSWYLHSLLLYYTYTNVATFDSTCL
jgi:hypothetical protein